MTALEHVVVNLGVLNKTTTDTLCDLPKIKVLEFWGFDLRSVLNDLSHIERMAKIILAHESKNKPLEKVRCQNLLFPHEASLVEFLTMLSDYRHELHLKIDLTFKLQSDELKAFCCAVPTIKLFFRINGDGGLCHTYHKATNTFLIGTDETCERIIKKNQQEGTG